jgi:hypothetical protein
MNFVCGEPRSTDPERAAPICLVVYLKPNGAEIQMLVVGRMSAYGIGRVKTFSCKRSELDEVRRERFPDFHYALIAAISG